MFGFLVGVVAAVIGFKALRRYRSGRHAFGGPRRWMTDRLFEFLDTSPEQESTLLKEMDLVEQHTHAVRHAFERSRIAYAQAIRGEVLDEAAIDRAFAQQQEAIEQLKAAAKSSLTQVHASLRSEQRQRAAGLLEWGPKVVFSHRRRMHGMAPRHQTISL